MSWYADDIASAGATARVPSAPGREKWLPRSRGYGVLVTKESRRQKDAEGREHPARQDVGGIVVSEVQCREDHERDRGEGARPSEARIETYSER
jgi:hypothetical protein